MARNLLLSLANKHSAHHQPDSAPSEPPNNGCAPAQDSSRVRSRLHALFHAKDEQHPQPHHDPWGGESRASEQTDRDAGELAGAGVAEGADEGKRSETPNGDPRVALTLSPPKPQREAIKVMVVTWNMGDALPKGDLSVLLGQVPPYKPQPATSEIPQLPVENAHPYHIVVVAGQECPTPSGAPRGIGGGLIKGMTLRNKRESKEKERMEKDDAESRGEVIEGDLEEGAGLKSPDIAEDDDFKGRVSSPMTSHSPFFHRLPTTSKGWSTMLDDFLCGPNYKYKAPPSLPLSDQLSNPTSRDSPMPQKFPTGASSPIPSPKPPIFRSASVPATPATPILIPFSKGSNSGTQTPTGILRTHSRSHPIVSPPGNSRSSLESTGVESSSESGNEEDYSNTATTSDEYKNTRKPNRPKSSSSPVKPSMMRPEIVIPTGDGADEDEGDGSYVHVAKERLMGMYFSVYVYKGAEHLIQGLDKDFVTAGLAGGRVGNKGGIGISLKLAGHRFLFVNSHLAAHTDRKAARIANINKIKSELRLDCFLPKDDPRSQEEDITERFDTVFWCGDLNFRLELSRLHADWLIEQKKYEDALKWDQLRMAMSSEENNPFPGFEEGPINFPCTFKYDVWKSVRATNRELRRTLKRRKSTTSAISTGDPEPSDLAVPPARKAGGHQKTLSGVPEAGAMEEMGEEEPSVKNPSRASNDLETPYEFLSQRENSPYRSDDDYDRRRSFESSRYSGMASTTAGTDFDDSDDDEEPQASAQQLKQFEHVFKEKTRHLLELVKMDGILTTSPAKKERKRQMSNRRRGFSSAGQDRREERERELEREEEELRDRWGNESRRTSMSSFVSNAIEDDNRRTSASSYRSVRAGPSSYEGHLNVPGTSNRSDNSHSSFSPPKFDQGLGKPPFARKMSVMKRNPSGKSFKDFEEEEDDEFEMGLDRREGIYDTSKKQRVPSWCDRVLWKAHVSPDPPSPIVEAVEADDESLPQDRSFSRLSTVFTSFGGHFRRTATKDPSPLAASANTDTALRMKQAVESSGDDYELERNISRALAYDAERNLGDTVVESPPETPDLNAGPSCVNESGLIPAPKRSSPARSQAKDGRFFPSSQSIPTPTITPRISPVKGGSGSATPQANQSTPNPTRHMLSFDSLPKGISTPKQSTPTAETPVRSQSPQVERIKSAFGARPRSHSHNAASDKPEKEKKKGRASDGIVGVLATPTKSAVALRRKVSGAASRSGSPVAASPIRASTAPATGDYFVAPNADPTVNTDRPPQSVAWGPPDAPHHFKSYAPLTKEPIGMSPVTHAPTAPVPNLKSSANTRKEEFGSLRRWMKEFPGWLHVTKDKPVEDKEMLHPIVEQEKRWQKGEVRCLHYGTIDDSGMRLLEGRSDHRPAIFAGAVYV
ncbi:hypothetical protein L198_02307 [Cryptococcus wingfieldii CBS 7118]|uniref:Inositol polyphosphate-related phosphatase domain-containing protein n=1 Tax=Cryptococcus wingfieldii CBS 7118 TaxID=1295528 RepID=A0A1E3JRG6_9TREE|nr:hypothetical protein L198_02307 [Cryptococcus wingfieldii CBS 7118]ODO03460.1 hypothetical protein L198_02307 [Cryptococcus wingfieldii CBS 7118]